MSQPFFGGARASSMPGRQVTAPGRSFGAPRGSQQERQADTWTPAVTIYDPWFSSVEFVVVSSQYASKLALRFAPVFANKAGPVDASSAGGQKYNREAQLTILLSLTEVIQLQLQLRAFMAGTLSEFVITREKKTLSFFPSGLLFSEGTPEHAEHGNGLAISLEQQADERSAGGTITFISRATSVPLADPSDTSDGLSWMCIEMMAATSVIDSFVANCARVDFAGVRHQLQSSRTENSQADTTTVPQPTRRNAPPVASAAAPVDPDSPDAGTDVVATPAVRPTGLAMPLAGAFRRGTPATTTPATGVTTTSTVADGDIDDLLSGSSTF